MIGRLRDEQLASTGELAAGLREWLLGGDGLEGEAAGSILAETILMWRVWLRSKMK